MSYRTILIYVDNYERAEATLEVALSLAERNTAHLNGLYVFPPLQLYLSSDVPIPQDLIDKHLNYHQELSDSLSKQFVAATANRDLVAEWRYLDSAQLSPLNALSTLSHTADLLIMNRVNNDWAHAGQSGLTEQVLLESSRPILIVPDDNTIQDPGKHVIIAWNGSSESTRAVFDALPMLRDAESVVILRINPPAAERHQVLGTASELLNTLSRHGVNVSLTQTEAHRGEIGEEINRVVVEQGADLLVMGAYGHNRIREQLFGGVTRSVFSDMNIPVLMSH